MLKINITMSQSITSKQCVCMDCIIKAKMNTRRDFGKTCFSFFNDAKQHFKEPGVA